MNEGMPPKPPHHSISKETWISLGLALAIGGLCFTAGTLYEKVQKLDGLGVDRRLVRIEATLTLVATRLGIPRDVLVGLTDEAKATSSR